MPDQVASDIFRLRIPLPDNPLGSVNVYAVPDGGEVHLVDTGWDTPEAYSALSGELQHLGYSVDRIRDIVVTHIHPDHIGLAERLARGGDARVMLHEEDAHYVGARYEDAHALIAAMENWLGINGVPPTELDIMSAASLQVLRRVGTRRPNVLLRGGEVLPWGRYRFHVLWTPGHSAGLVCLHDPDARVLLSTDHVLPRISPHVGLHVQTSDDPLAQYMASLRAVRDLPVRTVLPGHGEPFADLPGRVDRLLHHHEERLRTIRGILSGGEVTAYTVGSRLRWRGSEDGWTRLAPFQRRMALTETLAHLAYLHHAGAVSRSREDGIVRYALS